MIGLTSGLIWYFIKKVEKPNRRRNNRVLTKFYRRRKKLFSEPVCPQKPEFGAYLKSMHSCPSITADIMTLNQLILALALIKSYYGLFLFGTLFTSVNKKSTRKRPLGQSLVHLCRKGLFLFGFISEWS